MGLVAAAAEAAPAKKALKKKEEEVPAQPAEPPKPVRHGAGVCIMLVLNFLLNYLPTFAVLSSGSPRQSGACSSRTMAYAPLGLLPAHDSTAGPTTVLAKVHEPDRGIMCRLCCCRQANLWQLQLHG
jgi:hypothetical protein